jgi:GNAT superfamily N-acetyltransferase
MIHIQTVETEQDLDAVRKLCWAYRDFLMTLTAKDQEIVETFYPVPKYRQLMEDLPEIHASPDGVILIAKQEDGMPVGCGMIHALDAQTSEIKRVFVTEATRGQGVAGQICEGLMDHAQQNGFKRMVLDTSRSLLSAQRLYARLGFQERGPYQPIPDDVIPYLLFYEKSLEDS